MFCCMVMLKKKNKFNLSYKLNKYFVYIEKIIKLKIF